MGVKKYSQFAITRWFLLVIGMVLGAAVILGIRFVTYAPASTHYHANFALYINGQREMFRGPQYYTDALACTADSVITPMERAHMHDNVNNVVHVEDHAVTWGQFFANIGWYMGPNFIEDPNGTMYLENGNNLLHLILNGQDYTDLGGVANKVINDQDKLLVSFGDIDGATLRQEYNAIPSTAHHYDVTPDPKSCSGNDDSVTIHDRLVHMF
jgi:hypothetical protein